MQHRVLCSRERLPQPEPPHTPQTARQQAPPRRTPVAQVGSVEGVGVEGDRMQGGSETSHEGTLNLGFFIPVEQQRVPSDCERA